MIVKLKKISIFIIFYFLIDIFFSYFLFNLIFLNIEKIYETDLENRIFNKDYKYTFKSNVSFFSRYNDFVYEIYTNNFGFRDKEVRKIEPKDNLIFLAGDSFLEGVGLDYKDTLLGYLEKEDFNDNTYLNSGLASYSTFIYKKKIISFIENNKNYKVSRAIVFLDKSDPIDDKQYYSEPDSFQESKKNINYKQNISDRSITFAFIKILGNFLDEKRRNIKYRFLISKKYNANFFDLTNNQVIAFKSIGNRRFISNYYTNNDKWDNETKKNLQFSINQLKELEQYLLKQNIRLDIFLYPWPFELMNENIRNNYLYHISKLNDNQKLNIHNCYDYFLKENILEQLEFIGQTFLYADIHYNTQGYKLIADCVKNKLQF